MDVTPSSACATGRAAAMFIETRLLFPFIAGTENTTHHPFPLLITIEKASPKVSSGEAVALG
jgi:hypothetical protein